MVRKRLLSVPWPRTWVALGVWVGVAVGVQAGLSGMGRGTRLLEERLELRPRDGDHAVPGRKPSTQKSPQESLQPWELVGV